MNTNNQKVRLTPEQFRQRLSVLFDCAYAWQAEDDRHVVPDPSLEEIRPMLEAAPELLEAAQSAVEIIRDSFGDEPGCESDCQAVRILEAAIKKRTPGDVGEANKIRASARLIAAAPELLEALKEAVEFIHSLQDNEGYPVIPKSFEEAIKKAEGR